MTMIEDEFSYVDVKALRDALAVLARTPKIRTFLLLYDPKALQQAEAALLRLDGTELMLEERIHPTNRCLDKDTDDEGPY